MGGAADAIDKGDRLEVSFLSQGSRSEDLVEPEDHFSVVCEMMHGLITGAFSEAASIEIQKDFFVSHIQTWASRFFEDLEAAEAAVLYMPVGTIGRAFMEIEAKAFEMTA